MLANQSAEYLFNFNATGMMGKPLIEATINYEIELAQNGCI